MYANPSILARLVCLACVAVGSVNARSAPGGDCNKAKPKILAGLDSVRVLRGDDRTAYRDPAVLYHEGTFYLFSTGPSDWPGATT